jgi:hypothetical protein
MVLSLVLSIMRRLSGVRLELPSYPLRTQDELPYDVHFWLVIILSEYVWTSYVSVVPLWGIWYLRIGTSHMLYAGQHITTCSGMHGHYNKICRSCPIFSVLFDILKCVFLQWKHLIPRAKVDFQTKAAYMNISKKKDLGVGWPFQGLGVRWSIRKNKTELAPRCWLWHTRSVL